MKSEELMNEINGVRETPMVFILGSPRSGTTLLQSSLNAHPNIVAPPESQFINLFYPLFGRKKRMDADSITKFVNLLFLEPLIFNTWFLDKADMLKKFLPLAGYADYPLLCKMVFYQMRKDDKKVLLISDKNPPYSIFADKLLKIFPEAKFIHIIREPRDNVNSNLRRLKKINPFFLARQWVGYNTCIEKTKRRVPDKFFTIIYEDMVNNAESTFQALCQYLKIGYDNSMMNHQYPERLKSYEGLRFYERAKTAHQNMLKPINTSNIGKWKSEMKEGERIITEIITAKFAREYYGYDIKPDKKESARISSIRLAKSRIIYIAWQFFTRMRFKNYTFNKWYFLDRKNF